MDFSFNQSHCHLSYQRKQKKTFTLLKCQTIEPIIIKIIINHKYQMNEHLVASPGKTR
jgi:hypothetical protein